MINLNKEIELAYAHTQKFIETNNLSGEVLGVFAYGSMNHNLYIEEVSDVDCYAIYVPTLGEAILQTRAISTTIQYPYGAITVKDVRDAGKMLKKGAPNFLEILYTDYYKINPAYEILWGLLLKPNRETIVYSNPVGTLNAAMGHVYNNISKDKNKGDFKTLITALYLSDYMSKYLMKRPYLECITATEGLKELRISLIFDTEDDPDKSEIVKKQLDILTQEMDFLKPIIARSKFDNAHYQKIANRVIDKFVYASIKKGIKE